MDIWATFPAFNLTPNTFITDAPPSGGVCRGAGDAEILRANHLAIARVVARTA